MIDAPFYPEVDEKQEVEDNVVQAPEEAPQYENIVLLYAALEGSPGLLDSAKEEGAIWAFHP